MSRPFWSARYVSTRAGLPEKLERGRAYFIGDEQVILVDYGNGPITYGNRPGPQGAPGEPVPYIRGQLELLTEASVDNTVQIFNAHKKLREAKQDLTHRLDVLNLSLNDARISLDGKIDREIGERESLAVRVDDMNTSLTDTCGRLDTKIDSEREILDAKIDRENETVQKIISGVHEGLMTQINYHSEAILGLISFLYAEFEKINNVFSIVVKLIASLYPNSDEDMNPDIPVKTNILEKNEILISEYGKYRVKNSYTDNDGGLVIILDTMSDSDQLKILTLQDGDELITEGHEIWTVSGYNIENEQGVITLSYAGTQRVIETLKSGDIVEYDSGSFTVNSVTTEGDCVRISLTLNE